MSNAAVSAIALAIAAISVVYIYSLPFQRDVSHMVHIDDSQLQHSVDDAVQAEFLPAFSRLTIAFQGHGLIVNTSSGFVAGKIFPYWNKVRQFLGVPYASSPVGNLRWHDPIPVSSWSPQIRRTMKRAPVCPQMLLLERQSEDCLFLDIYAPTVDRIGKDKLLPVMVWIHGGAWIIGSGNLLGVQNPAYISQHKNVIIVSVQYRLGALGFLVTEDLQGNFGIKDQEFALKWIHDNIGNFGGDAKRVTLWGESAGGMSIGFHLTSPISEGLFHNAIMESNVLGINYRTKEESLAIGQTLAKRIGCSSKDIACMRRVPATIVSFLRLPVGFFNGKRPLGDILLWTPVIDGSYIVGHPRELMMKGQVKDVPILLGYNHDEAGFAVAVIEDFLSLFLLRSKPILLGPVYDLLVKLVFNQDAKKVLERYPPDVFDSEKNIKQVINIVTDNLVICPMRAVASSFSMTKNSPIHMYSFDFQTRFFPLMKRCHDRDVCHAMELPYVFHSLQDWFAMPAFTEDEHTISHAIVDYWTAFAAGSLNKKSSFASVYYTEHDRGEDRGRRDPLPIWKAVTPGNEYYMQFDNNGTSILREFKDDMLNNCDLWERMGYVH